MNVSAKEALRIVDIGLALAQTVQALYKERDKMLAIVGGYDG